MKIIVGLGNPGVNYKNTRHNAGFIAVQAIAESKALNPVGQEIQFSLDKKLKARIYHTVYKGEKIILVMPDTFMNASGVAVLNVMKYYKANTTDLIIIADDIDLPLSEARVRHDGGSAGQKGLQNIIDVLGTNEFTRIRIGINDGSRSAEHDQQANNIDTADYVLQGFGNREMPVLKNVVEEIVRVLIEHLSAKEKLKAMTIKVE